MRFRYNRPTLSIAWLLFLVTLVLLANADGLWAAPGAQGTAPPPSRPTVPAQPPASGTLTAPSGSQPTGPQSSSGTAQPGPAPISPFATICLVSNGGTCTSAAGDLIIQVPAGVAPSGAMVILERLDTPSPEMVSGPALGAFQWLGHLYRLSLIDSGGRLIDRSLDPMLTVTISYTAADLDRAEGNADNFVILRYQDATGLWDDAELVNPGVDSVGKQAHIATRRLGFFALLARAPGILSASPSAASGIPIPGSDLGKTGNVGVAFRATDDASQSVTAAAGGAKSDSPVLEAPPGTGPRPGQDTGGWLDGILKWLGQLLANLTATAR